MYIIKNAWKSIVRNKGRNILLIIIALVIAVSACVALSVREAAEKAKSDTLNGMSVTAQLAFDRTSLMQSMQGAQSLGSFDRDKFDMSTLRGSTLTLDDYMGFTGLLSDKDGYYYSLTVSMNAAGELQPYSMDSGSGFNLGSFSGSFGSAGRSGGYSLPDFRITGFSSYDAMLPMFGEDGTYSVTSSTVFDETSAEPVCVISSELALYNRLNIGDTVTLSNPANEGENYTLTISGIYTNASAETQDSRFTLFDPANTIYMNVSALGEILGTAAENGGENALTAQTSFTYVLKDLDSYETFRAAAEEKGQPKNYTFSSGDAASYENSVTPLNTLSDMTGIFFLIVLGVGGIILVVLNIFNLRERKYEIGVLTAIGIKKSKVAVQFVCELFIITFAATTVGAAAGAAVSVPVTNTLLEQ